MNGEIISDDDNISEKFNSFFLNAVKSLDIVENTDLLSSVDDASDEIEYALKKYKFHPSILQIKKSLNRSAHCSFSFTPTSLFEVENELKLLNAKKSGTHNDIPTNILKENIDICKHFA